MRVLIIDPWGQALDISLRAREAGHQVKHFIKNEEHTRYIGKGLIDRVDDFRPWIRWSDLIINAYNTRYLRELDYARKEGALIVGPSVEAAEWELDRELGMKVMRKCGINTAPYTTFNNYDKAMEHVKKEGKRFVSKPNGENDDKALSYCSKSPADMCHMLQRWKKTSKIKGEFILQEFISGTEMAVGAWVGPHGFNQGWCENWEFKKLMDGDLGVATGEQGTVLRYVKKSKLADMVLAPCEKALQKLGYIGYIDVNCIIDENGQPWPLEFTMRPGWPTFNIQQELHSGDPIEWLRDLALGKDRRNTLLDTIAIGVVLSVPDYPYSHLTRKEVIGTPIHGLKPSMMPHVHLCEVMQSECYAQMGEDVVMMPCLATAGDYVLVMSATGPTVLDAKRTCYRRLGRLTMPSSPMYRTDIGDRLSKQLPKLQKMGFAMGMNFSPAQA